MFGLFKPKFEKFFLNVPYSEKDDAKALGAKWDPKEKKWYASSQKIKDKCHQWWSKDETPGEETNSSIQAPQNKIQRQDLNVPFKDKDEAKALGAKWDPVSSNWYVTNAADKQKCEKWFPAQKCFGPYEILISNENCYRCGTISQVAALAVSGVEDGKDDLSDIPFILMHLEYLDYPFVAMLKHYNPGFSKKFSKTLEQHVWMNCCDACGAHFGDYFMMNEPGGAFRPTSHHEAANIQRAQLFGGGLPETGRFTGGYITDYKEDF